MAYRIGIDARKLRDESGIGSYIRNLTRALAEIDKVNEYHLFVSSWNDPLLGSAGRQLPRRARALPGLLGARAGVAVVAAAAAQAGPLPRHPLPAAGDRALPLGDHGLRHPRRVLPALPPVAAGVLLRPAPDPPQPGARRPDHRRLAQHQDRSDGPARASTAAASGWSTRGSGPPSAARVEPAAADRTLARLGIEPPYLLLVDGQPGHSNLDRTVQAFAAALERRPFAGSLVCVGPRTGLDFKVRAAGREPRRRRPPGPARLAQRRGPAGGLPVGGAVSLSGPRRAPRV